MSGDRLARWVCPYGSTRRVLRGPARGLRVIVEPGLGLTYLMGTDAAAPRFFCRTIKPGMTVIDVGANRGQMTLLFAALVGKAGCVVALEPAPAAFASLERNVRLNGLAQVEVLQAAAAASPGMMAFAYSPVRSTQGKLIGVEPGYDVPGAQRLEVRAMPLDDLLLRGVTPDVMKLDVEGGAASALRGARRIIEESAPSIYAELHGPEEQAAIRDELLSKGYVAETLDGTRVADPTSGWFSPLWCYKH